MDASMPTRLSALTSTSPQVPCKAGRRLLGTFTNQAFDSLIPSLKFRRFDAVMVGMDITPERESAGAAYHAILRQQPALFSQQGQIQSQR